MPDLYSSLVTTDLILFKNCAPLIEMIQLKKFPLILLILYSLWVLLYNRDKTDDDGILYVHET